MGNLVFGMMQSLDGYVAGVEGVPQLLPPEDEEYDPDEDRTSKQRLEGRRSRWRT